MRDLIRKILKEEVGVPSGDEQHGGVNVVGDHDGMMALIKKVTGADMGGEEGGMPGTLEPASADSQDYADEEGPEEHGHEEHEHTDEETCNECGYTMEQCACEPEEALDEVESEDQMAYEVAEANEMKLPEFTSNPIFFMANSCTTSLALSSLPAFINPTSSSPPSFILTSSK